MADEIEIKLDLGSFTNYLKLLGHFGGMGIEEQQQNTFFDTKEHTLQKQGWALRVRITNTQGFITLKGTTDQSGAAAVREEMEVKVSRSLTQELVSQGRDILSVLIEPISQIRPLLKNQPLIPFLTFENLRRSFSYRLHDTEHLFEVDRTEYPDGYVDYELEIELTSQEQVESLEHALKRLFESLEIPFVYQTNSKFARALNHTK